MRRCSAPLSSVQTFAGSKKFLDPARKIGPALVVHSYPLNFSIFGDGSAGAGLSPLTTASATTPLPTIGNDSVCSGGLYVGSTNRAAYRIPRWTEAFHRPSVSTFVNG